MKAHYQGEGTFISDRLGSTINSVEERGGREGVVRGCVCGKGHLHCMTACSCIHPSIPLTVQIPMGHASMINMMCLVV